MINRILERLEKLITESFFRYTRGSHSDGIRNSAYHECKKIVQEVAKEYGKDTNVRSKCDTCANNTDFDEIDNGCYMCCKGLEDNYEPIEQKGE